MSRNDAAAGSSVLLNKQKTVSTKAQSALNKPPNVGVKGRIGKTDKARKAASSRFLACEINVQSGRFHDSFFNSSTSHLSADKRGYVPLLSHTCHPGHPAYRTYHALSLSPLTQFPGSGQSGK